MPGVVSIVVLIGATFDYDLIPPAGQDLEVTDVGASVWVGAPGLAVPQVRVGLFNGVIGPAWFRNSTLAAPNVKGWLHTTDWFINNTNYIRINNPGAAGENVAISVKIAADYGPNGQSRVISALLAIPAAGFWDVIPPAGQNWCITDVGSGGVWIGGPPFDLPNVQVDLTDGASFGTMAHVADAAGWDIFAKIHISNGVYMRLTAAVADVVGFSGYISKDFGPNGISEVASLVATVGAAPANVLIVRPPVGQEWKVTRVGSSVFTFGPPPGGFPDLSIAMTDGALVGVQPVLMQGTDPREWFDELAIYIDRTHWLLITDTGLIGADIGVSAIITEA